MPALIIKHSETEREIIYDANQYTVPHWIDYRIVNLMPIEIQRIREATLEEVQKLLRKYI